MQMIKSDSRIYLKKIPKLSDKKTKHTMKFKGVLCYTESLKSTCAP